MEDAVIIEVDLEKQGSPCPHRGSSCKGAYCDLFRVLTLAAGEMEVLECSPYEPQSANCPLREGPVTVRAKPENRNMLRNTPSTVRFRSK